jgi:hypothetical protein
MKIFSLILAGAVLCLTAGNWQLCGQTTDVSATVQFSNGQTVVLDDFSDQIGVQPGEVVSVTIQFAPNHAGEPIKVESLDGGRISNPSTAVSDEGLVTFSFQGAGTGQNRVVVRHGSQTVLTHFWVLSSNPQNNPPVITSVNSEG